MEKPLLCASLTDIKQPYIAVGYGDKMKNTFFALLLFLLTFLAATNGYYIFRLHTSEDIQWQNRYALQAFEQKRAGRYRDFWTVRMIDNKQQAEVRDSANRRLDKWLQTLDPDLHSMGSSLAGYPEISRFVAEIAEHRKKHPFLKDDDEKLLADKITLVLRNAQIIEAQRKETLTR
jgi:hypothetical protein